MRLSDGWIPEGLVTLLEFESGRKRFDKKITQAQAVKEFRDTIHGEFYPGTFSDAETMKIKGVRAVRVKKYWEIDMYGWADGWSSANSVASKMPCMDDEELTKMAEDLTAYHIVGQLSMKLALKKWMEANKPV